MKYRLTFVFGFLGVVLACLSATPCTQDLPAEKKPKTNDIEGIWSQVYSEADGDSRCSTANYGPEPPAVRPGEIRNPDLALYIWSFTKEKADSGWDNKEFPRFPGYYELNPNGKMGAIDMFPLGKDGKKMEKLEGIYSIKDDVLIMCFTYGKGVARPEKFTTSNGSKLRLVILRRGKMK